MSENYDNWERLVAAVLKREQLWQMFHEQSKSPSVISSMSSDFSTSLGGQTPPNLAINKNLDPPRVPSTAPTLSRGDGKSLISAAPSTKIAWYRRRKPRDHSVDVRAKEDVAVRLGQVTRFSLRQIQVATNNFSNKNLLTRIGSVKVYKGRLGDGSLVEVIRVSEERSEDRSLQFKREVEIGSNAAHRNLLCLRGFCKTPTDYLLIYPFMVNGSVATCLRERTKSPPLLDWCTRKRIALSSARGLVYLHEHCDPKIIHCGIKAANILLDEEFDAHVGNFSRAKLVKYKDTTTIEGTMSYVSFEYLSSFECPEKIDVFGYGVLLLELISGLEDSELARLANDKNVTLLDWVKGLLEDKKLEKLVDAALQRNYEEHEVEQLTQIALLCTQRSLLKRPKMSEILRMLESDRSFEKWKKMHKEDMFL